MSPATMAQEAYGVLAPLLTHTPDVTAWPGVQRLWHVLLGLAAFFALGGFGWSVVRCWATEHPPQIARLAMRLLVPTGLCLFSLWLCHVSLQVLDACLQLLGTDMWTPPPSLGQLGLTALLWWLPWLLTVVLLTVTYLVRLSELALLAATSGLAAALLATPLEHLGARWYGLFLSALTVQFLQAVALLLARSLAGLLGPSPAAAFLASMTELALIWRLPALVPQVAVDRVGSALMLLLRML
jgi:hypothetical protein